MYIEKLRLSDFGKFHNQEVELKDGLNVVYGSADAGKTTMKDFIVSMLYGIDKSKSLAEKTDMGQAYKPSDRAQFTGSIDLVKDNTRYTLDRNFDKNEKKTALYETGSGQAVSLKKEHSVRGVLFNMDKTTYMNAMCMSTEDSKLSLTDEFKAFLAKMSATETTQIDLEDAIAYLEAEKSNIGDEESEMKMANLRQQMELKKPAMLKLEAAQAELDAEIESKSKRSGSTNKGPALRDEKDRTKGNQPVLVTVLFLLALAVLGGLIWFIPSDIIGIPIKIVLSVLVAGGMIFSLVSSIRGKNAYDAAVRRDNQLALDAEERAKAREEIISRGEDEHIVELQNQIEALLEDKDEYERLVVLYEDLEAKMASTITERQAIDAAISSLKQLSMNVSYSFGKTLVDSASRILGQITENRYTEVKVIDANNVQVKGDGDYMNIETLSTATIELLYLAVRLAAADLLCSDQMPMLIDNLYAECDNNRMQNALYCLAQNTRGQVIYFTSDKRTLDVLKNTGREIHVISL